MFLWPFAFCFPPFYCCKVQHWLSIISVYCCCGSLDSEAHYAAQPFVFGSSFYLLPDVFVIPSLPLWTLFCGGPVGHFPSSTLCRLMADGWWNVSPSSFGISPQRGFSTRALFAVRGAEEGEMGQGRDGTIQGKDAMGAIVLIYVGARSK